MNSLKQVRNEFMIVEKEEEIIYTLKHDKGLNVYIYDEELLDNIIEYNFEKQYKKILYLIYLIENNNEDSSNDTEIVLLKMDKLKNYLINNYSRFLSRDKLNKYLSMLYMLEEKIYTKSSSKAR